jgi:hypothetical protein
MNLKEFEDVILHSNENIQKIASAIINESSNAAFVAMFDDSVILLDHNEGTFYSAKYQFDNENLSMTFEEFEEFELTQEENDFRKSVRGFFENENSDVNELAENYVEDVLGQEKFINETINKALSAKDLRETIDYSELASANDELKVEETTYFKKYAERMKTHPVEEAKFFNFKDPVVISLVETEQQKLVNSSLAQQAQDLWKREGFRKAFNEACRVMIEDVEEGAEELAEAFATYPQVFYLDKADRKAVFGKSLLNSSLRESIDEILEGIEYLLKDNENLQTLKEYYIAEQEEKMDDEEEETDDDKEEDAAPELTPDELKKISDDLMKVAEKVEDENLKKKLDDIIEKLSGSVEEGTRPDLVKEAIQLLTI